MLDNSLDKFYELFGQKPPRQIPEGINRHNKNLLAYFLVYFGGILFLLLFFLGVILSSIATFAFFWLFISSLVGLVAAALGLSIQHTQNFVLKTGILYQGIVQQVYKIPANIHGEYLYMIKVEFEVANNELLTGIAFVESRKIDSVLKLRENNEKIGFLYHRNLFRLIVLPISGESVMWIK